MAKHKVAVRRCLVEADRGAVQENVEDAIGLAGGLPDSLRAAKSIIVKPNFVGAMNTSSCAQLVSHRGRPVHDSDPQVIEAVVAAIRKANPGAIVYLGDGLDLRGDRDADDVFGCMDCHSIARRYDLRLIDFNEGTVVDVPVPANGLSQRRLFVREEVAAAECFVSIAKLKCHNTAGVTLSLKNMFGLLARRMYGDVTRSLMHQNTFRLMRVFVDVNLAFPNVLQVIDGIVGATHSQRGRPVESELLLVGTDPVATDSIATRMMGFDPTADYPNSPFSMAENHLKLAARAGLGSLQLNDIDTVGDEVAPLSGKFEPRLYFTGEQAELHKRESLRQAQVYLQQRRTLLRKYLGKYILLVEGKVALVVDTPAEAAAQRHFNPDFRRGFLTQVLPEEEQVEKIEAYLAG